MLKAAFNPAGGVRYHLRARRHRDREWAPFRAALDAWLARWEPGTRTLAIVGPSGGHCLPVSLVARFERLICFEPDPTARPIFASRLRSLAREAGSAVPDVQWIADDAWIAPVLAGRGVPTDLIESEGAALLFTNFLGQVSFLVPDERWMDFRAAWRASLWPLLERVSWASFHDRVSGEIVPRVGGDGSLRTRKPLVDDEIVVLYGDDQHGELLDHRTDDLLPRGASYAYFDWPIVPGRHHLVEGVVGNVPESRPGRS
ncbi:hypothetical protein K2Z84_03250 [Candidatus Binatia bacterium]|nr:hypothetical protein [Candidatus Binatia bacterium]